jgi:glutaredoxin
LRGRLNCRNRPRIYFLAGNESRFVTGEVYGVAGGQTAILSAPFRSTSCIPHWQKICEVSQKMRKIIVYGADWCPLTRRTIEHLRELGVEHVYINVENDTGASNWVKAQNKGKELKPTVDLGGRILAEPTNDELDAALRLP